MSDTESVASDATTMITEKESDAENDSDEEHEMKLVKNNSDATGARKSECFTIPEGKLPPIPYGWDTSVMQKTKDIDFKTWMDANNSRDMYFIGPDNYIYPNPSTMKKFISKLEKKQLSERSVSIIIKPMRKVISTNPRTVVGITGIRYIHGGGTYNVQTVIYQAKEYTHENSQTCTFKLIKIHVPFMCLSKTKNTYDELYDYMELVRAVAKEPKNIF